MGRDKKRLSVGWRLQTEGCVPESPRSPLVQANNDEQEKKERRRSMAVDAASRAMLSSPYKSPRKLDNGASAVEDVVPTAALNNGQLSELYSNCIKLCTENKINQKNSWSLNLIDYISDVLDSRPGEMTNFQVASCTLDASVKIYSYRVDSVHSEAYKVLGGLSRSGKQDEEASNEDDGDQNAAEQGEGKPKKKMVHRNVNTIEHNVAALNVKKFDLEFAVDPLFSKTSAAFDEGGARGLLLNHLSVQKSCELVFDSQDSVTATEDESAASAVAAPQVVVTELLAMLPPSLDKEICHHFSTFMFTGWTPSAHGSENTKDNAAAAAAPKLNLNLDDDATTATGMFAGGANDDSDYEDYFAGGNDMPMFDNEGSEEQQTYTSTAAAAAAVPGRLKTATFATATDMVMQLGEAGDYCYFNDKIMKNWAGPSHWRVKAQAKDATTKAEEEQKPRKKDRFFIDLSQTPLDPKEIFATSRASTTLAKSTLDKANDNLLPDDVHYKVKELTHLFLRPSCSARPMVRSTGTDFDQEVAPYNYNNPNDQQNYCADDTGNNDYDDDFDNGGNETWGDATRFNITQGDMTLIDTMRIPGVEPLGEGGAAELQLLAQPRKVEKIEINYAREAKRVNVKQLKANIWSELTTTPGSDNMPEQSGKDEVTSPHSFAQLVSEVPKKVSGSTAKNLSVPIMFVCLLHLANEKSLVVQGTDGMNDLIISQ
eukprot:m.145392 g.145392  ORF g.145392 m.145392 type:complete len:712 (+) comp20494_c0_seq1:37-2172(+)